MGARYLSGETCPIRVPVDAARVIAVGDLVYLATDDARAAAETTWDTSLAVTQENFHDVFLGVALTAHGAADAASEIMVATRGRFEFDCASANFAPGTLVGPAKQTGDALENQKVVTVATANLAVGRATMVLTAATKVPVEICGTLTHGGPMTPA